MDKNSMSDLMHLLSSQMGGEYSNLESIINNMHPSDNISNNTANNSDNVSNEGTMPEMPDIETIMKIKKIMDSMKTSSNDPSINLLSSLKPYMREEKKSKIDQYIKFLNMSKAMSILGEMGSDSK